MSSLGNITDVAGTRTDDVPLVSSESMGECAILVAVDEAPRKPRAGKQEDAVPNHTLDSHDAVATGVGYVGTEVVPVVVRSGGKVATPIASVDRTGNTFRNFLTGGIVKGYPACESDVPGGETGKVVDKNTS